MSIMNAPCESSFHIRYIHDAATMHIIIIVRFAIPHAVMSSEVPYGPPLQLTLLFLVIPKTTSSSLLKIMHIILKPYT